MLQPNQRESGSRHTVIMGCDGVGVLVATSLSGQGHTVHVLDSRSEAFEGLPPGEIEAGRIVPIVGDGTLQQDLVRASIQEADVFMALSKTDTRNALAAQMARQLYQVPRVICRIDDPTLQEMYSDLGIVAISATRLVTNKTLQATSG